MKLIADIWGSSLGKKYIMAISGAVLFLFVVGHLVGNLQIFLGRDAINRYGYFLQNLPELLWPARVGLLTMVGLHITSSIALALQNRAARPVRYETYQPVGSTYAARTMLVSGIIVAVFIIYHVLHFTAQTPGVNLTGQDFHQFPLDHGRADIYRMMVTGFQQPIVSAFYVLGVGLLCAHISHGVSSLFQSLGLNNPVYMRVFDTLGAAVGVLLFVGYSSIPVAVLAGFLKQP